MACHRNFLASVLFQETKDRSDLTEMNTGARNVVEIIVVVVAFEGYDKNVAILSLAGIDQTTGKFSGPGQYANLRRHAQPGVGRSLATNRIG